MQRVACHLEWTKVIRLCSTVSCECFHFYKTVYLGPLLKWKERNA